MRPATKPCGGPVLFLMVLSCLLIAGCDGPKQICGPGTALAGEECIPTDGLECAAGTVLINGECVADADAVLDTVADQTQDSETSGPETHDGDTASDLAEVQSETVADTDASDAPDGGDGGVADSDAEIGSDEGLGCAPLCVGKACGDDGCGGTCGSCDDPANPICDPVVGACVAVCVPDCLAKTCGSDGCGGTCGTCDAASSCLGSTCVPDAWTCDVTWFGAQDACDCGCGALDSDCGLAGLPLSGCDAFETCSPQGECVGPPAEWTCPPSSYGALDVCDCGCGAPDPDCQYSSLAVIGCVGADSVCLPDGTCEVCVADCTDKVCGDDGCGGICGTCDDPTATACNDGQCVDPCGPTPLACLANTCGDDGCGGSCGSCAAGSTCKGGSCAPDDVTLDPTSCEGYCGSVAPAGCYCTIGCADSGNCCADYEAACTCLPNCDGKSCGGDGCGGSCGTCGGTTPFCGEDQQCTDLCTPDCGGKGCGDDGCGGSCGSCGSEATCSAAFQCVPDAWTCPSVYFDDGQGCDCGCGAADPDCEGGATVVFGCPTTSTSCTDGVCDVAFCNSNADCAGQWCTGVYAEGDGTLAGACGLPDPEGAPPGTPCLFDEECSTRACVEEQCRWHCESDADCSTIGGRCRGAFGAPSGVLQSGGVLPIASVCDLLPGTGGDCSSQSDCEATGEVCTALMDPLTLAPMFVCAPSSPSAPLGASCAVFECGPGQVCADGASGPICTLPCPAGDTDCTEGWTCQQSPFHAAGTHDPSDDPEVPVCLP